MIATSSRKAVAGVVALAALAMAGCTPPHQNPSAEKVDTATSQDPTSLKGVGGASTARATSSAEATNVTEAHAINKETGTAAVSAEGTPTFNNCDATGLLRPDRLTVDCKNQDDFLEDIVWDQWGEDLAEGTATRVVVSPDNREEGVKVVLGSPQIVNGVLTFTTVTVDGQPVVPENNY